MNIDANVQKMIVALIRRWKLLAVFVILGALVGYFYTANFTTLTYSSSVTFLAETVDSNQEMSDDNNNNTSSEYVRVSNTSRMNYAMKMLPTYIEIMKTNEFNRKVADDLNNRLNSNYSANTIKHAVTVEQISGTAMFVVNVVTTDSELSYEIAHQLETSVLKMMKKTNSGLVKASVEDKAVPASSAGKPGYVKKCLISAAIGLVIAAAYVILRSFLDVRIKTDQELSEKYNIPVLGSIPNFEGKSAGGASSKKERSRK